MSCHVATSDTLGQNAVIKQSDAPLSVEFSRLGNWRWCLSWLIVQWVVRQLVTGGIEHELPRGNKRQFRAIGKGFERPVATWQLGSLEKRN